MKRFKKLIALLTIAATLSTTAGVLNARQTESAVPHSGYAYEGTQRATSLSPAIALGTVAIVAIIAVLITNDSSNKYHGSYHGHSHSHYDGF
jgi:hypothetical protein